MNVLVDIEVRGPLVTKRVDKIVQDAIVQESLNKVRERLTRYGPKGSGGKGLGVQRNVVTTDTEGLTLEETSTLRWPRTKGTKKAQKDVGIVRSMLPRVLNKVAERIVNEL